MYFVITQTACSVTGNPLSFFSKEAIKCNPLRSQQSEFVLYLDQYHVIKHKKMRESRGTLSWNQFPYVVYY